MVLCLQVVLDDLITGIGRINTEGGGQILSLSVNNYTHGYKALDHLIKLLLGANLLETVVILEQFALTRTSFHLSPHVLLRLLALLPSRSGTSTFLGHGASWVVI